jgi:hypothetical protein
MKTERSAVWMVGCLIIVGLVAGCENIGDLTGGSDSKSSDTAPVLTNEMASASAPMEVWVNDNYDSHTDGWGYDHFRWINDGLQALAPGGTIHILEGWYPESVDFSSAGLGKDIHIDMTGTVDMSSGHITGI